MKQIIVTRFDDARTGSEVRELTACLNDAGIRDYSIGIERFLVVWIGDREYPISIKRLADAGFEIAMPSGAEPRILHREGRPADFGVDGKIERIRRVRR